VKFAKASALAFFKGEIMKYKFEERFFCPAPWTNMNYHINNTSPCHLIRNNLQPSPKEYLKSNWLKNIKQEFVDGKVPDPCKGCKAREDLGLKSTRNALWANSQKIPEGGTIDISEFPVDRETQPTRIEFLFSNLCNFKCRMCHEECSSELAKENIKFSLNSISPLYLSYDQSNGVAKVTDKNFEELKEICLIVKNKVAFSGGEPMLTKECYELMDFLIEHKRNEDILLEFFTNCSVWNPQFINRVLKFKKVNFIMSIDGIEKTAEYQRHGTKWNVVKENILKFNSLNLNRLFNTAISGYVLLDAENLAKFLMELYNQNNEIATRCYSVSVTDDCHWQYMPKHLQEIAIQQIDKAVEILTPINFERISTEFKNIKKSMLKNGSITPERFITYTQNTDKMRNESFEQTFGIKLIQE
jgi:organic radical activating enzyme